jgi:hypothetical protein
VRVSLEKASRTRAAGRILCIHHFLLMALKERPERISMKSMRTWIGVLSTLAVAALLTVSALAPRAVSRIITSPCDLLLEQSGGYEPFGLNQGVGVDQPFGVVGNVAACSLTVDRNSWGFARAQLVQWDPDLLLPDPATVALRTRGFDASALMYGWIRDDFYPPVVTRSLSSVAERPRPTLAFDWRADVNSQTVRYDSNGPAEIPAAQTYPPGGGARAPLPGVHPVISHAVCGGNDTLQSLQVVQSVITTTVTSDTSCYDLIQRFRVPVRSRLNWIEVAFGVAPRPVYFDPVMAILDAEGQSEPPANLPPSLIEAPFAQFVFEPFWGSHFDFDRLIVLEPNHDYWLLVRVEHRFVLFSRMLTGQESSDFTANIGPSFRRTRPDTAWTPERGRALCFKLIGVPLEGHLQPRGRLGGRPRGEATPDGRRAAPSVASLPDATPTPAGLRVRVQPNPARGAAFVSWSGAAGAMRIDVLDAQGRRVAGNASPSGANGQWMWSGARDDGRPLPAGLYFIKGLDGAGRIATDRLVLIR